MTTRRRTPAATRPWWSAATSSLALAWALLAAAGCGLLRGPNVTPTTFYVLSSSAGPDQVPQGRALSLGLGPVTLPPYLDRPQMVRRIAPNELAFDEFNRWSESLKENFTRVLGNDLEKLVGIDRLVPYPWYSTAKMDYAVAITVMRFEQQPDGQAVLDARWSIRNAHGEPYVNRDTHLSRPAGTPAEVAAAMSGMTGDLARDIALALRELDASAR
jgi:uncharacterized lipoprotein YmbA